MSWVPPTIESSTDDSGRSLHLVALGNEDVKRCRVPAEGSLLIGRDPECDMELPSLEVSRKHARLIAGPVLRIEDLGSSNGTTLRGERLRAHRPQLLEEGQSIEIGPFTIGLLQLREAPRERQDAGPEPVFESSAMHAVLAQLDRVAKTDVNVLLLGETGVGKDVLARWIHARSRRAGGVFLSLNCAAINEALLESELFGHEKGAFTGADGKKIGLLASASSGTVYLDEVGELTATAQAKLLKVIEEKQVLAVGSVRSVAVDVRFICATNRALEADAESGAFRRDLYYRLASFEIRVPPLRDRSPDIVPLSRRFIQEARAEFGRPEIDFDDRAKEALLSHLWPGNVRQLKSAIERAVLLHHPGAPLSDSLLPLPEGTTSSATAEADGVSDQKRRILDALRESGGNQSKAAEALGVSRKTLGRWLDRYEIPRPRKTIAPPSG